MGIPVIADRGVSEHLIDVSLRANAHVFLTKRPHMVADVGILLQLSSVDAPNEPFLGHGSAP